MLNIRLRDNLEGIEKLFIEARAELLLWYMEFALKESANRRRGDYLDESLWLKI